MATNIIPTIIDNYGKCICNVEVNETNDTLFIVYIFILQILFIKSTPLVKVFLRVKDLILLVTMY